MERFSGSDVFSKSRHTSSTGLQEYVNQVLLADRLRQETPHLPLRAHFILIIKTFQTNEKGGRTKQDNISDSADLTDG